MFVYHVRLTLALGRENLISSVQSPSLTVLLFSSYILRTTVIICLMVSCYWERAFSSFGKQITVCICLVIISRDVVRPLLLSVSLLHYGLFGVFKSDHVRDTVLWTVLNCHDRHNSLLFEPPNYPATSKFIKIFETGNYLVSSTLQTQQFTDH